MRTFTAALAALALAGATAAPALADDASLTAAVKRQQQPTLKALKAFKRAGKTLGDPVAEARIRRLHRATLTLSNTFARYLNAVGEEEASTDEFGKAQTALLSGLRKMRGGLATYDRALVQWLNGADERTVKRTIESSLRRFDAAERATGSALDVLLPDEEAAAAW